MKSVVFKWIDHWDSKLGYVFNQQVCTTYEEVVEFVSMNIGGQFRVDCWDE